MIYRYGYTKLLIFQSSAGLDEQQGLGTEQETPSVPKDT